MKKVKALSKRLGDSCTTSECLSLFAVSQSLGLGIVMDIALNDYLLTFGLVSTLRAAEGLPLVEKAKPAKFAKYGLLTPSQVRATPLALKKFSKLVIKSWFEIPVNERRELVSLSEKVLCKGSASENNSDRGKSLKSSLRALGFNASIRYASFITGKNLSEEIIKALYEFADDVISKSVQDETFRFVDPESTMPVHLKDGSVKNVAWGELDQFMKENKEKIADCHRRGRRRKQLT